MPSMSDRNEENGLSLYTPHEHDRALSNSVPVKEENFVKDENLDNDDNIEDMDKLDDDSSNNYAMDMPLEVITTVDPFYTYPVLKNMSNGVLTHRNIFTEQERSVLEHLVDKYRGIVDTRSRTREIYLEKQTVWQQIVDEYNSTDNIISRTEKELRKCWDNMKYRKRQAEKEQQYKEEKNELDSGTLACNAVQMALQRMMSAESNAQSEKDIYDNQRESPFIDLSRCMDNAVSPTDRSSPYNYDAIDDLPDLKKVRQESPKLSSILLGEAKKTSPLARLDNFNGDLTNCFQSRLTNGAGKSEELRNGGKSNPQSRKRLRKSLSPVSILPKNLGSCVSITNIPNPNQHTNGNLEMDVHAGAINLGGGVTISPQRNSTNLSNGYDSNISPINESHDIMKSMSSLQKIFPMKTSKRLDHLFNGKSFSESPSEHDSDIYESDLPLRDHMTNGLSIPGKPLDMWEATRLEHEEREHMLRIKVLEQQLLSRTNESHYWALKLKMLQNGHSSSNTRVNGKI